MGKGEFYFLALYITQEALLRYNNASHFCLSFGLIVFFFFFFFFVCVYVCVILLRNEVHVDVGGSDTEGKRWRLGCDWDLRFLECSWAFSWQCTSLSSSSLFPFTSFTLFSLFQTLSFSDIVLCSVFFQFGFQYNFEGRYDLVRFVKTIQKAGLYAHLRIGPYVCAEWNFGYPPNF